jgi:hypothetical protein
MNDATRVELEQGRTGMRSHILKALGIATAAMALATSAQAQGRYHPQDHPQNHHDRQRGVHRANGDVLLEPRHIPPGLAKKPGQMPPGQFKRYTPLQGANTLSGVLRRRGYTVQRVVPSGSSRIVYYRDRDGAIHRAIVSPGTSRLGFSNVPSSLMQEVLSALYQ